MLSYALPARAEPERIGIMSGGVTGTYVRIAQNMADALDSNDLRLITMLGRGSRQNIKDLIELDGVDLAIVQSDVLREVARTNEIPGAVQSIRYITKLYNEEIHVLVRSDVSSIKYLEGAAIAVGRQGSGTEMTASILFEGLGIQFDPVNVDGKEAIDALADGLISAAVFVVGKPSSLLTALEDPQRFRLIDVRLPKSVEFPYFDVTLDHDDYPALIPPGERVSTVAVGAILAAFNWRVGSRRYSLLERFTNELFSSIELLRSGPYHPKWKGVDLKTQVPGWTRFQPAQDWLAKN